APTLIGCYLLKNLSASALTSFALRRESFCSSAAEKRDYEAVFCSRQEALNTSCIACFTKPRGLAKR
ncbi:MAG TPA: hypothetical protein VF450_24215, partial [Noviherbaspirillum sp.]